MNWLYIVAIIGLYLLYKKFKNVNKVVAPLIVAGPILLVMLVNTAIVPLYRYAHAKQAIRDGNYQKAIDYLTKCQNAEGDLTNSDLSVVMAQAYLAKGDYRSAIKYCDMAIKRDYWNEFSKEDAGKIRASATEKL